MTEQDSDSEYGFRGGDWNTDATSDEEIDIDDIGDEDDDANRGGRKKTKAAAETNDDGEIDIDDIDDGDDEMLTGL